MHCTPAQADTDKEMNITSLGKSKNIFNLLKYIKIHEAILFLVF